MAGDGGQGGAEEAANWRKVVWGVVHAVGPNEDPQHDGENVPRVLAEGGKAHDGENAPDGGAVEIAPHQEDVRSCPESR